MVAGSIPKPKTGDWLEHEAFSKSGWRRRQAKRSEIVDVSHGHVSLYIVGEPGVQRIKLVEMARWWNTWLPPDDPEDVMPPDWLVEGCEFWTTTTTSGKEVEYRIVVRVVRGAWLSYVERSTEFADVFRMVPYSEFVKVDWHRFQPISVWDWLRKPAV